MWQAQEDHPRSRGEYLDVDTASANSTGSSPLSRGIRAQAGQIPLRRGIIPALAGNTSNASSPTLMRGDHPRSRGEYAERPRRGVRRDGSSPLSRGIPQTPRWPSRRLGIIPALAGNTCGGSGCGKKPGDHPRSRGEYAETVLIVTHSKGSSPLSRGIPVASAVASVVLADHPRSRGEYT